MKTGAPMGQIILTLCVSLGFHCGLAAAADRVVYKHTSDRDLGLTLTKPQGWAASDRWPAILFFFNGGWKEPGATKPQFEEQTRYFAARGMVVGQADYREKSKDGPTSSKCVEDIFSGVRWLRSHAAELGVDPKRIAAVGGSGSIHLPAAALHADELCTPGEDASIDPLPGAMFLFNPDPDVLDPAMMQKLVQGGAAKPVRTAPPMVIYYGSRDAVAPFLDEFVTQARQAGLPVEKFVGDGGVHGFFKFSPGLERTVEHMDRRLCALGLLDSEPKVELPHKAAPPDYEQRILATQQQWLERHNQLAKSRGESPPSMPAQNSADQPARKEEPRSGPKQPSTAGQDSVKPVKPSVDNALPSPASPPVTNPSATPLLASHIYQTFGERKLQLAMHYPPGWKLNDRRAAILFFSGSHKVQADKDGKLPPLAAERAKLGLSVINRGPGGEHHVPLCDAFAKRGFVVMRVEYRTRGKDGVLPGADIEDAISAMRWVRSHAALLGIDANRIVAAGGSSGGYLAASLFAFESRYPAVGDASVSARPNAILLYSPLVDWLDAGSMSDAFLVVLNGDKDLGAKVSPARYWSKDCPPTLVMVGTEEPPFQTVKAFAEKWKAAGAPMELFVADGGEHGFFGKPAWLEKTLSRTEAFLRANKLIAQTSDRLAP